MSLTAGSLLLVAALLAVIGEGMDAGSPVTTLERVRRESAPDRLDVVRAAVVERWQESEAAGNNVADDLEQTVYPDTGKTFGAKAVDVDVSEASRRAGGRERGVARFSAEPGNWQAVDRGVPGNSTSWGGVRAEVTAYQNSERTPGVGLSLQLVADEKEAAGEQTQVDQPLAADPGTLSGGGYRWAGLTHEQELFRTKWGWHAFDQVQKALREDTSQ